MLILGGFTEKSDFWGRGFIKKQCTGGNCLKRGEGWTSADLRGLGKKRGGRGGGFSDGGEVIPNADYDTFANHDFSKSTIYSNMTFLQKTSPAAL